MVQLDNVLWAGRKRKGTEKDKKYIWKAANSKKNIEKGVFLECRWSVILLWRLAGGEWWAVCVFLCARMHLDRSMKSMWFPVWL